MPSDSDMPGRRSNRKHRWIGSSGGLWSARCELDVASNLVGIAGAWVTGQGVQACARVPDLVAARCDCGRQCYLPGGGRGRAIEFSEELSSDLCPCGDRLREFTMDVELGCPIARD